MDFLNPLIAQIRDLFASMTPGARVTAGLLLAVVAVSLGFLFQQSTMGPDQFLFGGDPVGRSRLPAMEAALSQAGVKYEVVSNRIKVAGADKNAAIAAIAAEGELPPEFHTIMQKALDGGGMFEFREMKQQRLRAALAQQASLTLSEFPWIRNANVIHNVHEESGLRGARKATAAVSVDPAPGETLTTKRMRRIKEYVSAACAVPIQDVVVTNQGKDGATDSEGISPEDFDHPLYQLKAQVQLTTRDQILRQLAYIPGVGVEVNATLDETSEQRIVEITPEKEPVTLSNQSSKSSDQKPWNRVGDRVGVEANGPGGVPAGNSFARDEKLVSTFDTKESHSAIGTKQTETVTAGFGLKEVDASVRVPLSYVEYVYKQDNRDANGEEPAEIDPAIFAQVQSKVKTEVEDLVQPLLPKLSLGEDKYRQVNVQFFRALTPDPIPEPSSSNLALGWFAQHVNTIAMAGLALVSLVMLRSVASSKGSDEVSGLPSLHLEADEEEELGEEDEGRSKLTLRKPETLKDDLSEMVSSDPDAAAAIVKAWINNAA